MARPPLFKGKKTQIHTTALISLQNELRSKGITDAEAYHAGAIYLLGKNKELRALKDQNKERNELADRILRDQATIRGQVIAINDAIRRLHPGQDPLRDYAEKRMAR